jgi:hypothetical protein
MAGTASHREAAARPDPPERAGLVSESLPAWTFRHMATVRTLATAPGDQGERGTGMAGSKRLLAVAVTGLALLAAGCTGKSGNSAARPVGAATTAAAITPPTTEPATTAATNTAAATTAPPVNGAGLTGTWNGTWTNTTPDHSTGTFRVSWVQAGSRLTGTITINGTPCLSGGTIDGTVAGGTISFGAVKGQVNVAFVGAVAGSTMGGTYSTGCGNAKGTWRAGKA